MGDRGRQIGMPLDEFSEQAYAELCTGKDQILIGTVGPPSGGQGQTYLEVVEKRRSIFEWLSKIMLGES